MEVPSSLWVAHFWNGMMALSPIRKQTEQQPQEIRQKAASIFCHFITSCFQVPALDSFEDELYTIEEFMKTHPILSHFLSVLVFYLVNRNSKRGMFLRSCFPLFLFSFSLFFAEKKSHWLVWSLLLYLRQTKSLWISTSLSLINVRFTSRNFHTWPSFTFYHSNL